MDEVFVSSFFLKNGNDTQLKIWDTLGQEKSSNLVSSFYRDKDIIMIVYDITDEISFQKVDNWID